MDDAHLMLAKFGPAPPPPCAAAPAGAAAPSARAVLALQFVASAAILALLQPPFAMTYHEHPSGGGAVPRLNPLSVLVVSGCAVGATAWLDASFKRGGRF